MSTRHLIMKFSGYKRPDGLVGTRNYIAVIPAANCVNEIAVSIAKKLPGVVALTHTGLCNYLGKDQTRIPHTLMRLGENPNVAGVLVVGLGCEATTAEQISEKIALSKKPAKALAVEKEGSVGKVIEKGLKVAKELLYSFSEMVREEVGLGHLTLAIKCGGSDTTSGIAGNIITGMIADRIVEEGGTVIFTETAELIGAEHVLAKRAVNEKIAEQIYEAVNQEEKKIMAMGVNLRGCEPNKGNIKGGVTTIEEKSLGAIMKSGNSPIQGVLEWGEKPDKKGLFFMDGPSNTPEIYSGFASAGAQILIFSMGGGLPAKLPMNPSHSGRFPIIPIVKLTGNPKGYKDIKGNIDIYVGTIIEGKEDFKQAADHAYKELVKIASGEKLAVTETFTDYTEPMNFYVTGPLV